MDTKMILQLTLAAFLSTIISSKADTSPLVCMFGDPDSCRYQLWSSNSGSRIFRQIPPSPSHPGGLGVYPASLLPGETAHLLLGPLRTPVPPGEKCVRLTYRVSGGPVETGAVGVKIEEDGEAPNPLVPIPVTGGTTSRQGLAHTFHNNSPFRIKIEARGMKIKSEGSINLQKMVITEGKCRRKPQGLPRHHHARRRHLPPVATAPDNFGSSGEFRASTTSPGMTTAIPYGSANCSFESGYCGYRRDTTGDINWLRTKGRVDSIRGPSGDHSTGKGYYIYLGGDNQKDVRGRIISPQQLTQMDSPSCLTFWYHMFGGTSGTLNVFIKDESDKRHAWSRSGAHANVWHQGQRTILNELNYVIIFEGYNKDENSVIIALDDITVSDGACPPATMCDFEADMCDFTNDKYNTRPFNWQRGRNGSFIQGTGPSKDHTTGTEYGHFVYLDASSLVDKGSVSRLLSPDYPPSGRPQCLQFWYHLFRMVDGSINVYISTKSEGERLVWYMRVDQGDQWEHGRIQLPDTLTEPWKLIFEGRKGGDLHGNLAIDDIRVLDGPCPPPGSCDFEADLCGYQNWNNEGYTWLRLAGQKVNDNMGPKVDHTTNSDKGFYIFTDPSLGYANKKAFLMSEYLPPARSPSCFSFWYHMYASASCTLKVYLYTPGGLKFEKVSLEAVSEDRWLKKEFTFQYGTVFRILFESTLGHNARGSISIDDIKFTPNMQCGVTPVPTMIPTSPTSAPSIYDCTFDDGSLCQWKHITDTALRFEIMRGIDKKGPKVDHTTGSPKGYYIGFNDHYAPTNQSASIESPYLVLQASESSCLRFWYHIFGPRVNRLQVSLRSEHPEGSIAVWRVIGTSEDQWMYGQVTLNHAGTYKIVFEAMSGGNWDGDISLDDISVVTGSCPPRYWCDFEARDICGFFNENNVESSWKRGQGQTTTNGFQPKRDHTYKSGEGHYMHVNNEDSRKEGDRARIVTPTYDATSDKCLRFWYYMSGSDVSQLNTYIRRQGTMTSLWKEEGNKGALWRVAEINVNSNNKFEIVYEAKRGSGKNGSIAIDDLSLTERPCEPLGSCDFERDMCTYTDDMSTDFQWVRHRGDSLTQTVKGPSMDHTLGSAKGWYMYMDVNKGHGKGDVGRFRSQILPAGQYCITYWYMLYGQHDADLTVYTETLNGKSRKTIQSLNGRGQQGSLWLSYRAETTQTQEFTLVFQGKTGFNYKGGFAIDDVALSGQACPTPTSTPPMFDCKDGNFVAENKVCDFQVDCANGRDEASCGNCTFEDKTFCSWSETSQGSYKWTLGSGSTTNNDTGPDSDHTTGTEYGTYAYVDSSRGDKKDLSRLENRVLQLAGSNCRMRFWYHMYGEEIGKLQVLAKLQDRAETTLLWYKSGPQGNKWLEGDVQVPRITHPFTILIRAERSFSVRGDIAIDDITISSCGLPPIAPGGTCPTGWRSCLRGSCYDSLRECDFTDDCGDFSDESSLTCGQYPSRCDFEYGTCGWKQGQNSDFKWKRQMGRTPSEGTGPSRDHTTGLSTGYYMYVDASSVRVTGYEASLYSEQWSGVNTTGDTGTTGCFLTFYYHIYGTHIGELKVYTKSLLTGRKIKLFAEEGDHGDAWIRALVYLTEQDPFEVEIKAIRGQGFQGDIAIDDTSFSKGCSLYKEVEITSSPRPTHTTPTPRPPPTPTPAENCEFRCGNGKCILSFQVCDFKKDCLNGLDEEKCPDFCDFEEDQCGWEEKITNDFDWTRSNGIITSGIPDMAPRIDHTYGGPYGYYTFLYSLKGEVIKNKENRFESPTFSRALSSCKVQFYYYIDGHATGKVNVAVNVENKTGLALWSIKDDSAQDWRFTKIGLGLRSSAFSVVLWREPTYRYRGTVAIDDIRFTNCAPPPRRSHCSTERFWCTFSKACISQEKQCDLQDDCGDGSDEDTRICGDYTRVNFESGLQIFKQGVTGTEDDFDWTIGTGSTTTRDTGPAFDHTTGTDIGQYVYINSQEQKYGQKAWLVSRAFRGTTDGQCKMRFWYHMYGAHIDKLTIYARLTQNGPPTVTLWQRQGAVGAYWERAEFDIVVRASFQVIIEGTIGDWRTGDIAVDDVTFTPACEMEPNPLPVWTSPPPVTPTAPVTVKNECTKNEFSCHNSGKCLDKNRVCDFRIDCVDGSDESTCTEPRCTFEKGDLCNWQPDLNSAYKWMIIQAKTQTSGTKYRPDVDHTTGTPDGWYMFADSSPGGYKDKTELFSRRISRTGPQCKMSFWYHMVGFHVGSLHIVLDHLERQQVWFDSGPKRPNWHKAMIFIGPKTDVKVILQARRGRSHQGDITIDDVTFIDCEPPIIDGRVCTDSQFRCSNEYCIGKNLVCDYADDCGDRSDEDANRMQLFCNEAYVYRCDFEFDMCTTWNQDKTDDFDWKLTQGGSRKPATGPHGDHTTGKGSYIYIETTYSVKKGNVARLSSNFIKGTTSSGCKIRFWYHMKGERIGSLVIFLRYYDAQNREQYTTVYNITGEQGDIWQRAEVDLSSNIKEKRDFQVVFQGTVGGRVFGDIAIDDISLTPACEKGGVPTDEPPTTPPPGTCDDPYSFACRDGGCYHPSQRCNFIQDCNDGTDELNCGGDCDFEGGDLCGWSNSGRSALSWIRHSGPTTTKDTGPAIDHTTNTARGHYMYIESSAVKTGDRAHLETAVYSMSGPSCMLTFWRHMYGATMGSLKVYVKSKHEPLRSMYSTEGNSGNQWRQVQIQIGHHTDFTVIIEATRGGGDRSDIAIDDIKYANCAPRERIANCKQSQYLCEDRTQCIDKRYLCDRKVDCRDGSDENLQQCPTVFGNCDFEGNWEKLCSWQQIKDGDEQWYQGKETPAHGTGPSSDHTIGRGGQFLFTDSYEMSAGEVARVRTPDYPASYGVCYLRFWYHMFGDKGMGSLTVYTMTSAAQRTLIWRNSGNKGDVWNYVNIGVGSNQNFSIVFEGVRGNSFKSDVAIDDVTFVPNCVTGKGDVYPTCRQDEFYCEAQIQCMSKSWLCDGEVDCPDGSDERNCNISRAPVGITQDPRRTWTVGPQTCPQQGQFTCTGGQCIPANLYCDGISDCRQGDDEFGCRSICHRETGQIYCRPSSSCLPPEYRCDGILNCADGADEAGCKECPSDYCRNNGICSVIDRFGAGCNCSETGYEGHRCTHKVQTSNVQPTQVSSNRADPSISSIVLGATTGLLLIVIICMSIYIIQNKRYSNIANRHNGQTESGMDNPLYGAQELTERQGKT